MFCMILQWDNVAYDMLWRTVMFDFAMVDSCVRYCIGEVWCKILHWLSYDMLYFSAGGTHVCVYACMDI